MTVSATMASAESGNQIWTSLQPSTAKPSTSSFPIKSIVHGVVDPFLQGKFDAVPENDLVGQTNHCIERIILRRKLQRI